MTTVPAMANGGKSIPAVPASRWRISAVGGQWGAFQPWAGAVYWLRLFDSFEAAVTFVREAVAKAKVTQ